MNEIKANRVADFDACKQAGDFYITKPNPAEGDMRRISFLCPCGCGDLCGVRVRNDGQRDDEQAWAWDKNEEHPTVSPSININNGHWHGYLIFGIFKKCD